jgi:hypothetical protein
MPTNPPTAERTNEESESNPPPHNIGIRPPTVEPIKSPIQINNFIDALSFAQLLVFSMISRPVARVAPVFLSLGIRP